MRFSFEIARMCAVLGAIASSQALLLAQDEAPSAKTEASKFIRLDRDMSDHPRRLQTAIVSYRAADGGATVDLVAAVHVGDKSYYEALNKRFEDYDIVLYELVAPQGTVIPKGGRRDGGNPVSMLQDMTRSMLDLESQTEQIDYTKKNFVHADLSPSEMGDKMRERGDNGLSMVLSVTADLIRQANLEQQRAEREPAAEDADEVDPLTMLFDPSASTKMKRMMARQFANPQAIEGGLGPTLAQMLVADRNEAAMKVFGKELAKGHKRIAIFYGTAHMPDFERRLADDFGMKPVGVKWVNAWDLTAKTEKQPDENPLAPLLKLLEPPSR